MRISHKKITASVDTGLTYWYLFKHGLGPGTMPKGVNVLKVIEDGWKDYVLLDQMLTTNELNEYEIKEATPPDDLLQANGYNDISETYAEFENIDSAEKVEAAWDDDTMSANVGRYYVTPDISDDDIEFAAESTARYLKRRGLTEITTEDVIEELRSLSDMWDVYWAYGLRTREQEKAFLDDFLNRLATYGITDVVDNTFASVQCSDKIEASKENPNIFDFYEWYNHLSRKNKNIVDDWTDEEGYPMYDDCSQMELSNIMDHFADLNPAGNFHVAAFGNDYDELQNSDDFNDPKSAITFWVKLQQKYPLNVMITGFAKQEQELRDYVVAHPDWIRQLCKKYNCPYDPEYLIAESEKPSRMKPSEYTDQLHPFGLG